MSNTTQTDTVYVSHQDDDMGHTPVFVESDGESRELSLRTDIINHSPTGFSWGYKGSGCSQLALAITAHAVESSRLAREHYIDVRDEFLVQSNEPFEISRSEIIEFITEN